MLGADQAAPDRGDKVPGPLRHDREAVAVTGGLAAEDDHAAGPEDPEELGEGLVQVGDVVKDGVAEDHVEALVLEGQDFGFGDHGLDREVQGLRGAA